MESRERPSALTDSGSFPLPSGTDVALVSERLHEGQRLPAGSIGRVVSANADRVEVLFAPHGVVPCVREELVPRRRSQVDQAARRELAWTALHRCTLLEATASRDAAGAPEVRGVFALPLSWQSGLGRPPWDIVSSDGHTVRWECSHAVTQALRAEPHMLELFFSDSVRATDEAGEWLLAAREAFVSRAIYGSFGRAAVAQLARIARTQRLLEHRDAVIDWLRAEPHLTFEGVAARLANRAAEVDLELARTWVKQLYRSLYDQGVLITRDFDALVRFARECPRELRDRTVQATRQGDALLRQLIRAIHWLESGDPRAPTPPATQLFVDSVRAGHRTPAEIVDFAEGLSHALEAAVRTSPLPAQPDVPRADAVLRRIHREIARRAIENAPGPFGREAPPAPTLVWDDEPAELT